MSIEYNVISKEVWMMAEENRRLTKQILSLEDRLYQDTCILEERYTQLEKFLKENHPEILWEYKMLEEK